MTAKKARDAAIDKLNGGSKMCKRNKVQATMKCVNYDFIQVVCSMYEVGSQLGGPKKKHTNRLQRYIEEDVYIYDVEIPVKNFEAHCAFRCYNTMESQYNSNNKKTCLLHLLLRLGYCST